MREIGGGSLPFRRAGAKHPGGDGGGRAGERMGDVRAWLAEAGLAELAETFEREKIDREALLLLTAADIADLGLPIGLRAKLAAALKALRDADPSAAGQTAAESAMALREAGGEGELRQLTTLFCDVVGYTELTAKIEPESLQRAIRDFARLCAASIVKYEGHVFQVLGDGVMAFFGWPHAHEREPERAIRAGLEIVEALAEREFDSVGRLRARIGVASGVVALSSAGTNPVGETVNLAARLQGVAAPGEIVVSEAARRQAGAAFDFLDLGPQRLKGIAAPARAFRVLGHRAPERRTAAAPPLVNRTRELGLLLECWGRAARGEGGLVALSGEPGIGKSRLLDEFARRAREEGARTMRLHCSPYHAASVLWPSARNLELALGLLRDESAEAKLDKLERLAMGEYGRPRADMRFLAGVLSIPCEARYGPREMTTQRRRAETLRALVDLTVAAARARPSALLFEDAHWADPTSLEVLDLLAERTVALPLLVVLTHRPEFRDRWGARPGVRRIALGRLSAGEGAEIAGNLAGGRALPPDLLERIVAKTDGVPLFVEELTRSILESGVLYEAGARLEYSGAAHDVAIPATLRDLFMERLDRHRAAKEAAQIGSAIGRSFSRDLIAAVAPMSPQRLEEALAELVSAGLALRREAAGEATYVFRHALLHETAYESMLPSRRRKLHARIAEALETRFPEVAAASPEAAARHLTLAGAPEAAAARWLEAGAGALRRMALPEAISHLEAGLALVPDLPASAERDRRELGLRRALGAAWMAAKGWPAPEARAALLPALKLTAAAAPRDMLAVHWGVWSNTLSQGRVAEAAGWAERLSEMAARAGDGALSITAELMFCVTRFWLGEPAAARAHGRAVLAAYEAEAHGGLVHEINHDPKTGAGVYLAQAEWMLGFPDRAAEVQAATLAHARARGHVFDLGFALAAGSDVHDYRGAPELQREAADECRRLGLEHSLPVLSEAMAPLRCGVSLIRAGAAAEGAAMLGAALEAREAAGGFGGSNPWLRAVLAEGLAATGDLAAARLAAARSLEQIGRPGWGERSHLAEALRIDGRIAELGGAAEAAEARYREALAVASGQGALSWELRAATSLALLLGRSGRAEEGRGPLAAALGRFTEGFGTRDFERARAAFDGLG